MVDAKSNSRNHAATDPASLRGEDEIALQLLTSKINDLSAILFQKNYVFSILGRHPKQPATFVAAVYTMGGKSGARTLDIGPESGESRVDVLTKLLWKVEVEVGKMVVKDSQGGSK